MLYKLNGLFCPESNFLKQKQNAHGVGYDTHVFKDAAIMDAKLCLSCLILKKRLPENADC